MRQNYKGNKKRIEEAKKKRKEEKRNKRLGRKDDIAAPLDTPMEGTAPETSLENP